MLCVSCLVLSKTASLRLQYSRGGRVRQWKLLPVPRRAEQRAHAVPVEQKRRHGAVQAFAVEIADHLHMNALPFRFYCARFGAWPVIGI